MFNCNCLFQVLVFYFILCRDSFQNPARDVAVMLMYLFLILNIDNVGNYLKVFTQLLYTKSYSATDAVRHVNVQLPPFFLGLNKAVTLWQFLCSRSSMKRKYVRLSFRLSRHTSSSTLPLDVSSFCRNDTYS